MPLPEPGMLTSERLPWHDALWENVTRDRGRLPHALLVTGQPGLGEQAFAERLAHALLCAKSDVEACGACRECQMMAAGTHPDLARIEPLEEGKAIVVDQIRALIDFATTRPHSARNKVTIIAPAERMNLNAANSLLKLLEEPPLGNIMMLTSDRPAGLPATIRSRCQHLHLKAPGRGEALAWLTAQGVTSSSAELAIDLAGGAPLQALGLLASGFIDERGALFADIEALAAQDSDPVVCAGRWHALGPTLCLSWLQGVVADLIKLTLVGAEHGRLANADLASRLHSLTQGLNLKKLYGFADAVAEAHALLASPVDSLLLLEDILIGWINIRQE
ncbi:MAG: DNA polymerase III subunit delta' [Acidiferrobacterales bacterium]|nr:DNA polymerase III subunit delta' [Acidiferrobacterales bacterium]